MVKPCQLSLHLGQPGIRAQISANDVRHGAGHIQGILACAQQVYEDLAVRKPGFEPFRHHQGKSGLPYAASSLQAGDGGALFEARQQFIYLFAAAGEVFRWRWNLTWNRGLFMLLNVLSNQVACVNRALEMPGEHRSLDTAADVGLRASNLLPAARLGWARGFLAPARSRLVFVAAPSQESIKQCSYGVPRP